MKITVTEARASGEYAVERVIEIDISDRDGFEADESRESDEAESSDAPVDEVCRMAP